MSLQTMASSAASDAFISQLLASDLTRLCLTLFGLSLAALIVLTLVIRRLGRGERKARTGLLSNSDGTATIEFALVFPVMMFFVLLLGQVTFMMNGNIFVHYAAFSAARSAIVQIPKANTQDPDDPEGINVIVPGDGSPKWAAIVQAAAMAMVPVSGQGGGGNSSSGGGGVDMTQMTSAVERFYGSSPMAPPAWVQNILPGRVSYALAHTDVEMFVPYIVDMATIDYVPVDGPREFFAKDPVTIRVFHEFHLSLPYVGRLFADGTNEAGIYRMFSAYASLTNEGTPFVMPPQPMREDVEAPMPRWDPDRPLENLNAPPDPNDPNAVQPAPIIP